MMKIGLNYTTPLKNNFKASLLTQMMQTQSVQSSLNNDSIKPIHHILVTPTYVPVQTPVAQQYNKYASNSLLNLLVKNNPINTAPVVAISPVGQNTIDINYKNNLRSMFQNNQAVIFALIPRTFTAKDTDNDGLIKGNERPGYFSTMVERLDELKTYGVNTLHLLPINPTGLYAAKGSAGSVYAPLDYLSLDPKLDNPNDPRDVYQEARDAIKECHKRDIKVMVDLPSCMSVDLYENRPDLRATDAEGNPKTPEGWEDIKMFDPWEDADKRILNKALVDYHKKFIDLCLDLGIDGIRADVGRAKPPEFWDIITSYARSKDPEFAFLAECYTHEDASPMKNMPADRPFEALLAGFDSFYGQYHIFHMWKAKDFHSFIKECIDITNQKDPITGENILPKGKSLIGSFATHDDDSPMSYGGPDYCMMTNVIQTTLPMTNPYMISGYESGDRFLYKYGEKFVDKSFNELLENPIYRDIANYMVASVENAPNIIKLNQSANKKRTLASLENDAEFASTMKLLYSRNSKNKVIENKNITFATALKNSQFNDSVTDILNTATQNKNIKEFLKSKHSDIKIANLVEMDSEFKNIINSFENYTATKDSIKYYVHPQRIDIFNESRQPGGDNPEIGYHMGYMMNCVRPKYGELITKGAYIELPVEGNFRDEVIAYARHKDGKTLVTIANHDVNSRQNVKVVVPGLSSQQSLNDLAPKYGAGSNWSVEKGAINIDLGPAQAHVFEVDTPNLLNEFPKEKVLQQYL